MISSISSISSNGVLGANSTNNTNGASQSPTSGASGVQDSDSAGFANVLQGMRAREATPNRPDTPKSAPVSKQVQPAKPGTPSGKPAADDTSAREPGSEGDAADACAPRVGKARGQDGDQPGVSSKAASDKDEARDKDVRPGGDPAAIQALPSPLPQPALTVLSPGTAMQGRTSSAQPASADDELSDAPATEGTARRTARATELRAASARQPDVGSAQAGTDAGQDQASGPAAADQTTSGRGFIDFIAGAKALAQGDPAQERQPAGAFDALQSSADARQIAEPSSTLAASQPALPQQASMLHVAAANSHIAARLGSPDWNEAFGQKIVWMAKDGEQSAQLSMNPPDLGPVQVVLSISQSQASADFSAAQPETRQALQDALPRLKEMLSDAGISLTQANVHAGMPQQQDSARGWGGDSNGQARGTRGAGTAGADPVTQDQDEVTGVTATRTRTGIGLVNTFA